MTSFVNRQHLLHHVQFGFRKKHSTVSQLARITDYISNGYNLHKHTGMILLDLEKVYDTVWIHGLLYKFIVFKLPTYLLFTLKVFLEGRSITAHPHQTPSSPKTTPSVLPQGAVLSTTNFALYNSDMPQTPNTQLALYVDDTDILAQCWRTDTIIHWLTHATSVLLRYFTRWKLQVNIHKTEAILFTRRRPVPPAPSNIQRTRIPWNPQVRYLGLLLESKLMFTRHLTSVIHKATGIFPQHSPSSHATQHCLYPIKSLCTNYVSALYSHTLPLFGATHHLPTIVECKFYSPNVSALLAITPGSPPLHVVMTP